MDTVSVLRIHYVIFFAYSAWLIFSPETLFGLFTAAKLDFSKEIGSIVWYLAAQVFITGCACAGAAQLGAAGRKKCLQYVCMTSHLLTLYGAFKDKTTIRDTSVTLTIQATGLLLLCIYSCYIKKDKSE